MASAHASSPRPGNDTGSNDTVAPALPTISPAYMNGVVTRWHATKGFGEIEDDQTGDKYFAFWTELLPMRPPARKYWKPVLQTGESVRFVPSFNQDQGPNFGKPTATQITGFNGKPILSDWITIPRCTYRGDPRLSPDFDSHQLPSTCPDNDPDFYNYVTGTVVGWYPRDGRGTIESDADGQLYDVDHRCLQTFRHPSRDGWYSTLQTGEHVRFLPSIDGHGNHASSVSGVFGRPLLCDWIDITQSSYRGDPRQAPQPTRRAPPQSQQQQQQQQQQQDRGAESSHCRRNPVNFSARANPSIQSEQHHGGRQRVAGAPRMTQADYEAAGW